jgi:hypothetical protein
MSISFSKIQIGQAYSRPTLASIWGYKGFQAISRGVVTPRDDNKVILFVTEEHQDFQEKYVNSLKGNVLHWEGPTDHFAEDRIASAANSGDEIHLFHRDRHHSDFVYVGMLKLTEHKRQSARPSEFTFVVC